MYDNSLCDLTVWDACLHKDQNFLRKKNPKQTQNTN